MKACDGQGLTGLLLYGTSNEKTAAARSLTNWTGVCLGVPRRTMGRVQHAIKPFVPILHSNQRGQHDVHDAKSDPAMNGAQYSAAGPWQGVKGWIVWGLWPRKTELFRLLLARRLVSW
jgi:hypothetical protein